MILNILKCISDITRLRILSLIFYKDAPMCVGDVEESLGLSQPSVSRHLQRLQRDELLTSFRKTQFTYYELNQAAFDQYKFLAPMLELNIKELPECMKDIRRMKNIKS
ncbi:hypothetical protein SRRS_38770 [Sporomusa rhizae]